MPDLDNPLGPDALAEINRGLEITQKLINACNLGQRAGIDCQRELEEVRDKRAQLIKLKQAYFPGQ